ncbi:DUF6069 family protein [Aquipuribacter nitratireducens]|uniref:DUF6069 family protein n=1 Tax=Aquipuribacter nitratireducens TaxID=650104 RepID=A0ABW0GLT3_9MICO
MATPTPTTPAAAGTTRPTRRLWVRGLLAALAAVVVNVVLFLVAGAAGLEVLVPDPAAADGSSAPLVVGAVAVASVVGVVAATVGRWVHLRFTRWPEAVFTVGVLVLLVLSFAQPFLVAVDASTAARLLLCLMHVVVAAAVLLFLGRRETLTA